MVLIFALRNCFAMEPSNHSLFLESHISQSMVVGRNTEFLTVVVGYI